MTRARALVLALTLLGTGAILVGRWFLTPRPPTLATTWRLFSRCLVGAPLAPGERPSRRLLTLSRSATSAPGPRWPARCAPAAQALARLLGDSPSTSLGRFRERAARAAELLAAGRIPRDTDALWADARAIGIDDAPLGDARPQPLGLAELTPLGAGAALAPDVAGGPLRLLFRSPTRVCEVSDGAPDRAACFTAALPAPLDGAIRLVDGEPGGVPLLRVLDPEQPGVYALGGARLTPSAGVVAYGRADGSIARVEADAEGDYHVVTTRGAEALGDAPIGPGAELVFAGEHLVWLSPTAPGRAALVSATLRAEGTSSILVLGAASPEARILACREGPTRAALVLDGDEPGGLALGDDVGFLPLERLPPVLGPPTLACADGIARAAWVDPAEGDAALVHLVACDASGCKGGDARLPAEDGEPPLAAPLGDGALVAWVAADGSLRARLGPLGTLADAPEVMLLDAETQGAQLESFALHARPGAVLVTVTTLGGTGVVRVAVDGAITPVRGP